MARKAPSTPRMTRHVAADETHRKPADYSFKIAGLQLELTIETIYNDCSGGVCKGYRGTTVMAKLYDAGNNGRRLLQTVYTDTWLNPRDANQANETDDAFTFKGRKLVRFSDFADAGLRHCVDRVLNFRRKPKEGQTKEQEQAELRGLAKLSLDPTVREGWRCIGKLVLDHWAHALGKPVKDLTGKELNEFEIMWRAKRIEIWQKVLPPQIAGDVKRTKQMPIRAERQARRRAAAEARKTRTRELVLEAEQPEAEHVEDAPIAEPPPQDELRRQVLAHLLRNGLRTLSSVATAVNKSTAQVLRFLQGQPTLFAFHTLGSGDSVDLTQEGMAAATTDFCRQSQGPRLTKTVFAAISCIKADATGLVSLDSIGNHVKIDKRFVRAAMLSHPAYFVHHQKLDGFSITDTARSLVSPQEQASPTPAPKEKTAADATLDMVVAYLRRSNCPRTVTEVMTALVADGWAPATKMPGAEIVAAVSVDTRVTIKLQGDEVFMSIYVSNRPTKVRT